VLKTRQLKTLRRCFGAWRGLSRQHAETAAQFKYRADFRLLAVTWGIWRYGALPSLAASPP
jgi:hypothetical protein